MKQAAADPSRTRDVVVRIVSATVKRTEEQFWTETLLGVSLSGFPRHLKPHVSLKLDNGGAGRVGLARFYNSFLEPEHRGEIALFVHDDVRLDDWWMMQRVGDAIQQFDVVGVAGNAAPDFAEPSWCRGWNRQKYPDGWQSFDHLSGSVAHLIGDPPRSQIGWYGQAPRSCRLLDGVFLAVNVDRALEREVKFDERFEFHFYDLDFCRTAERQGLRLGTWPIAISHGSAGAYGTPPWLEELQKYADKWHIFSEHAAAPPTTKLSWVQRMLRGSR